MIALALLTVMTSSALAPDRLAVDVAAFRPPATPLVTHTPYFSVYATTDRLTDGWTRHWTGTIHAMVGMLRIDGKPYRFLGLPGSNVPAMEQTALKVLPTRTLATFEAEGVKLEVEFCSPLLADDLELLAKPVTYVTLKATPTDGKKRDVQAYFDATAEWCVNSASQFVEGNRFRLGEIEALAFRSREQPILAKSGDDLRIDWGTFYVAGPRTATSVLAGHDEARDGFAAKGVLPAADNTRFPRRANDDFPVAAFAFSLDRPQTLMLAYDEEFAIEYFHRKLPPYWKRRGKTAGELLTEAARDAEGVRARCAKFDGDLMKEATERGGEGYAQIAALAYRQCLAAHAIVQDLDGTLLMFSKENFSNGCIGTVDVTYPGSPFFLKYNVDLLKAQVEPILDYAASPRWPWPFAPHDLGTYPLANGQVYGGGERTEENQMPVEECGNMLLMVAAICRAEGSTAFADKHWSVLTKWADYLVHKGVDPENQLCTDDFAGHLAHNANLSVKAILAIGAYAQMSEARGEKVQSKSIRAAAEGFVKDWLKMADDGTHFRLAFDRPGTWSQKYNLYWDGVLGLNLFPKEAIRKELDSYKARLNEFGLPLDNRADYTKIDWCLWTASLTDRREEFDAMVAPLVKYLHASPSRVPLSDWHDTKTSRHVGFQARSVVGGVFAPMLRSLAP